MAKRAMIGADLLIIALAFVAGFLLIFGANMVITDLYLSEQKDRRMQMMDEIRVQQREMAKSSALVSRGNLADLAAEALEETSAKNLTLKERMDTMFQQAGMKMKPEKMLTIAIAAAAVLGGTVGIVSGQLLSTVLTGFIAFAAPFAVVEVKRKKRLEELRSQLPDCFDLMARVLRAGQTISQGMKSAADEFRPPAGAEFGLCYEQQNLGLNPEVALRDLARRTGLLEMQIFVLAVLVQRQTGGNLTELLDKLSTVVRDRYRMRDKIKGLTAEGRMQGVILMMLPVGVYGMLLIINRPYAMKLFDHPWLPISALISMGIGALWIRKIVNFDY